MRTDKLVQNLVDGYGNWVQKDCENCAGGTARMTKELYPYTSIFSPVQVNRMTIKNRIVMAPMGNVQMCEEDGRPNNKMQQYFFARAKGGVGLLTTGLIPISHGIDTTVTEPGKLSYFPRIDRSRTALVGWRDLAQGCHAYGSRIFIQLTPGLGRVGPPTCVINEYKLPVSASMNPNFYIPEVPCLPLTDLQLNKIVKNAGQAAIDAKTMGLDGVYLHGHEGYLLDQITNPAFNRRKLGKYADWQRFGIDMIQEIRKRVGDAYPIMYRIDLSLALNETYGSRMDSVRSLKNFKNGRTIHDTLDYMENLVKAGVDMFDVDLGCYDNWWLPHPPASMPAGCFLEVSKVARDYFKKKNIRSNAGLEVPIVAVGKLGYPDLAEKALRDGMCDMIMLGRPLLADPDWCVKAFAGEVEKIRPCIGCQEGCINEFIEGGHIQCAVNPRTGFEDVIPEEAEKAAVPKKIGVVGAGPAGIQFAITAAKRGHQVELLEKSAEIGGKVIPGSVPKIKYEFENYLAYLKNEVALASAGGNLSLKVNTEVTNDWLKDQEYDAIVFANGTKSGMPPIPGIEEANVVQATELLVKPELLGDAKDVVIVGGGVVGCETAYWLSYEQGRKVKVVEMMENFMDGTCTANRGHLIHYMEKAGVELINCAKVVALRKGQMKISRNISKGVPDPYVTWQPILPKNIANPLAKKVGTETRNQVLKADLVVLATGGRADETPYLTAQREGIAAEVYNIGDSFHAGRVLEASRAADYLARRI
ncbi:MAG: FAD-dependent oxidoreductase [Eubacteriales bacterium]|nr:FAD-dependent oxidoreductase [Eubacteriales bacterium]